MPLVTVFTADVIDSRRHGEVAGFLTTRLADLTHPVLLTPFTVSRGDEFQGLCRGSLRAPEIVRLLRYRCRPLSFRLGIGIGEGPATEASSSWGLNGEAFFRAREALERTKKKTTLLTAVVSGDERLDAVAEGIFVLLDAVWTRWTKEQWEAVLAYERYGTYEAAGQVLGIAFQNVAKRCRAARWPAVRVAETALRRLGELMACSSPEQG
ncbi:MAG: hypothetical protein GX493_07045 [Firmicutes bacterium]|nr:hypothetical protein [Bacillota bacterium]